MLTFPTLAEQCLTKFNQSKKSLSISTIAERMGAERIDEGFYPRRRVFYFDDDTTLVATGTGVNLRVETHLP